MGWITVLGFSAAFLTTLAFLPQVLKVFKTRHTKDLSLGMYVVLVAGILLWLTYGLLIHDLPIVLANSVTFVLASSILVLKLIYK